LIDKGHEHLTQYVTLDAEEWMRPGCVEGVVMNNVMSLNNLIE
jgi:hypothetical protein